MPSTLGDNFTVTIEGGDGGHAAAVASGFADDAEAYAAAAEAAQAGAEASVVAAQTAVVRYTPFPTANTAANSTGGDATAFNRLLDGIVDVRLFGVSDADTYRIERVRRNASGNWGARITRASDNATVAESYYTTGGGFAEPTDPAQPQEIYLATSAVAGAWAIVRLRWSEFASGAFTTGWTAALRPECLDRFAPSPANTLTASAVRPGQMVMSLNVSETASVDETARTFTWPALLIPDGRSNTSGRFRIAAGSVTFSNSYEVAFVDLVELATYGTSEAPNTVVRKGVYGRDANDNSAYSARPNQLPLAWSVGVGRVEVNSTIRLGSTIALIYGDDLVVKVDPPNSLISLYQRANGTSVNQRTYIRTDLYHYVAADGDNWSVRGVFECSRTGYETFSGGQRLQVDGTEILLAIQESGAADFMGGNAHGDEQITQTPTLLIDGREISLSGSLEWYHGRTAIFAQKSRYYRVGSSLGTPLCERSLLLTFDDGEMLAQTRLAHLASWTVSNFYSGMLAPHRYVTYVDNTSENTGTAQISGKYLDNVRGIPYDISARQASTSADDTVRVSPPVTRAVMWGTYGVSCEVEVLEASHAILTDMFYINRQSYAYNKGYIGFIGTTSGNQSVTSATVWAWKTRWRWRSKN